MSATPPLHRWMDSSLAGVISARGKKAEARPGRRQARGRVPASNTVLRDGLSNDKTLTESCRSEDVSHTSVWVKASQEDGTARVDLASMYPQHFASIVGIIFDTIYILAKCILVSWITLQAP